MSEAAVYAGFLGIWTLIPESCQYEQGDPPASATYRIAEDGDKLLFTMHWVDGTGETHQHEFSGVPDGVPVPFSGGELADQLVVRAVSPRELTSAALSNGEELMVAQRQLDETGTAMRITQVVRFQGGYTESNVGIYRKNLAS